MYIDMVLAEVYIIVESSCIYSLYKTNIKFSDEELTLLNKGLKYNLNYKCKNWITTLALEAETVVNQLPILEQDHMRHQVAITLWKLHKHHNGQHHYNTKQDIQEKKTLDRIKEKLNENKTTITKADKGHSIVIIPTGLYQEKVKNFVQNNDFQHIEKDLTKKFQKDVRTTIQDSPQMIPKEQKWKYVNLNPPHFCSRSSQNT